ncbi:hypothetical protein LINPERPRIM_LOCUS94 [Linum perenne]
MIPPENCSVHSRSLTTFPMDAPSSYMQMGRSSYSLEKARSSTLGTPMRALRRI